jgi:hypothetical protein
MPCRVNRLAVVFVLVSALPHGPQPRAEGPAGRHPIRGLLIGVGKAAPEALTAWKAEGGNAVVVPLDESVPRDRWAELADAAGRAGLDLYPWVEVARNPAMAAAHPGWMAGPGGHHDDWRRRFPDAPRPKPGEVVKAWP